MEMLVARTVLNMPLRWPGFPITIIPQALTYENKER